MSITANFTGRVLGLLRAILRFADKFNKRALLALPGGLGMVAVWHLFYNAVDDFLEAQVNLSAVAETIGSGAQGSASIGEILSYANFYFPVDTLGYLAGLYLTAWSAVVMAKNASNVLSFIKKVHGGFKV